MQKRPRGKEQKGKNKKDPKDKPCNIHIFTEGDTEEIYLKNFDNAKKGIKVLPKDSGHTDAIGIVRFAKDFIDDKKNGVDTELGDRCYCVFDSDPKSNTDINRAFDMINGYRHKGLFCIFSNPAFERWFIMHYRNAPYGQSAEQVKSIIKDKDMKKM